MSVLFGISRAEGRSQEAAFGICAVIVACLSLVLLLIVKNPKLESAANSQDMSHHMENNELQMVSTGTGTQQDRAISGPYEPVPS